ncbi:hypothetical protein ACHAXT_006074 [Thalassiosira profunda]
MQIVQLVFAAALVGVASAKDPSAAGRPARKRSNAKLPSKVVKADEAYDPFLGLSDRKLENKKLAQRELQMSMPDEDKSMPSMPGESYCTWGPNYTCYETGWPSCCSDDAVECPEERPECEITLPPTPNPTPGPTATTRSPPSGAASLGVATAVCAVAGSAVLASL